MKTSVKIIIAISVAYFAVATISHIWGQSNECAEKGGVLVRGLYWFDCVDKK